MGTYRNENRNDQWRTDQGWRPGDNDRDRDRDRGERERGGERERSMGERGGIDERYLQRGGDQRFGGRDDGRHGRGDEGGRFGYGGASSRGQLDDDRQRYGRGGEDDYGDRGRQGYGYGGQSGSQAGGYGYDRESTGYGREDRGMMGHARMGGGGAYETTGYGYGGGMGMMNEGRGNIGDREGYQYRDRGGMGYGERGGGFSGGMSGGQGYGGGVARGRERDLGAWRNEGYTGGHRGKGPSGYTRSDERIREDVCQALQDDDDIDATHIEINVKGGEVTLSGNVTDRRMKRMAEDVAERLPGVKDVSNNIRVQSENTSSNAGNGRTGRSESVSSSTDKDTEATRRPRA